MVRSTGDQRLHPEEVDCQCRRMRRSAFTRAAKTSGPGRPDAVRPTLKPSEEAPEKGADGARYRRGPGLRTGPAAGLRRSEHAGFESLQFWPINREQTEVVHSVNSDLHFCVN